MSFRHRRIPFAPGLEALEDRAVPSVSVSGTTLTINGTNNSDRILITYNGSVAATTINDNGRVFTITDVINTAFINTFKGNDVVEVRSPVDLPADTDLVATVNLGKGEDSFLVRTSKNVDAGAQLAFIVNGDSGRDTLTANLRGSHVYEDADVRLTFRGGSDEDSLFLDYKGRVIGDLSVNFDGGDDEDRLNVTARFRPPEGDLGNGTFRVIMNGGDDEDTIGAFITKQPGGDYRVSGHIDAGGDNDDLVWHTANISASGFEKGGIVFLPEN